jgi:hypothetical protein
MSLQHRILALAGDLGSMQAIIPVVRELKRNDTFIVDVGALKVSHRLLHEDRISGEFLDVTDPGGGLSASINGLLDRKAPDLVLLGSSPAKGKAPDTLEQFCILGCRRRKIPTVSVLDFWGMYRERFVISGSRASSDLLPDILCVLDEHCRQDLIRLGVPSSRMRVTHNPWMDLIAENANKIHPPTEHTMGIEGICGLFVSQPLAEMQAFRHFDYDQHQILDLIIEALPVRPGKCHRLLIWKHPGEDENRWKDMSWKKRNDVEVRLIEERGASILSNVDFVATSHSTVIYEALYYGTTSLSVRPSEKCNPSLYSDELKLSKLTIGLTILTKYFKDFDSNKARRRLLDIKTKMLKNRIFFSDGRATYRVIEVIRQLLCL